MAYIDHFVLQLLKFGNVHLVSFKSMYLMFLVRLHTEQLPHLKLPFTLGRSHNVVILFFSFVLSSYVCTRRSFKFLLRLNANLGFSSLKTSVFNVSQLVRMFFFMRLLKDVKVVTHVILVVCISLAVGVRHCSLSVCFALLRA